jgi:MYXO-CTERM domain-containing protein
MKKYIVTGLLALGLSALPLTGVASAQQAGGSYQTSAEQGHGDLQGRAENQGHGESRGGMDWGWLGLFGLAGLAGLRHHRHEGEATTGRSYRAGERTGEPLGSR